MITSEENRPHAMPRKVAFSNGAVQQFKLNLRVAQVYYYMKGGGGLMMAGDFIESTFSPHQY